MAVQVGQTRDSARVGRSVTVSPAGTDGYAVGTYAVPVRPVDVPWVRTVDLPVVGRN